VIQEPGDSGESSKTFARIKIEQSQSPRYGARCVASRPLSQSEAIVRLSGALTKQSYRTIQIDKYRHLEEPRILAFLNHSCHPTVLVDTSCLMVFAARDIVAGEELGLLLSFHGVEDGQAIHMSLRVCALPPLYSGRATPFAQHVGSSLH
jgi:hypothetical protein